MLNWALMSRWENWAFVLFCVFLTVILLNAGSRVIVGD